MWRYFNSRFWIVINLIRFKLYCINHGGRLRICGRIGLNFAKTANVEIGYNLLVFSGHMANPMGRNIGSFIKAGENAHLVIGDKVGMTSAVIRCEEKIEIGNNVKIGALAIITDSDAHSLDSALRLDPRLDRQNIKTKPIKICNNVLIGAGSFILKGVTIGENSVIGAGSVVTKDIPANVIAAGNPCKVIRDL